MMFPLPVPTQRRLHDNSSDVTRDNTFLSVAVIYNNNIWTSQHNAHAAYNIVST